MTLQTETDFDHSQATVIFVIGLLSVLMCAFLGPVAFLMGNSYRKNCAAFDVRPEGLGTAGWILGIIGTIQLGLVLLLVLIYIVIIILFFGVALFAGM